MTLITKPILVRSPRPTSVGWQWRENVLLEFFSRWEETEIKLMKERMLDCHRARRKVHFEDEIYLVPTVPVGESKLS